MVLSWEVLVSRAHLGIPEDSLGGGTAGGVCQWHLTEASDRAPRTAVPRTAFRAHNLPVGNARSAAADKPRVSSGLSEFTVCGVRWGSLCTSFLHVR